jgi:hypothetical protein
MKWLNAIVLAVLLLGLSACGSFSKQPPQAMVERAIATQLAQTQQALIEQLAPSVPQTPNFKLSQVNIADRQSIQTGPTPIYRVRGAYSAVLQLPSRQVKEDSVFDIYLQSEVQPATDNGKPLNWYLVKPTDAGWQRTPLSG